jgi:alpha-galactosidase
MTIITFIGAGSHRLHQNIAGRHPAPARRCGAPRIRLMDIDPKRLEESEVVVGKLARPWAGTAQGRDLLRPAPGAGGRGLRGGELPDRAGYEPATVTDFEVPKRSGLRQTIADTLGVGGIMRGPADRARTCGASART